MMLLKVVAVGRLRERSFAERCDEYRKRLNAYAKLQIVEVADSDVAGEGTAILRELDRERQAEVVALSEEGKEFSTAEFAAHLAAADGKIVFVIGGPFGLAPEVKKRARFVWSLSRLTFTHEMARMLLLEQLYRCCNLNAGGSYHHR